MTEPRNEGLSRLGLWLKALSLFEMKFWAAVLLALVAATFWRGTDLVALGIGLGLGAASWVVLEYVFHRFLLHLPVPHVGVLKKFHARLHWQHHQTPGEPRWLFVPWWATLTMYPIAAGIGWLVGQALGLDLVVTTTLGFVLIFGHYETTHLAAHVPYHPRTELGRKMKRHHLLHHFKNERYWFGVTNPWMDMVFGTWKKRDEVPKSATARTLGVEPE